MGNTLALTKSTPYHIRQANLNDCAEIERIWRAGQNCLRIPLSDTYWADIFRRRVETQDDVFQVWVAEDDAGDLLGWQSLSPTMNHPVLRNLIAESSTYICPNQQAKGVGRGLLSYALRHAQNTPLKYVVAFIFTDNVGALRIIDSLGFKRVGDLPNTYNIKDNHEWMFIAYEVPPK
jgi:L-amino acid N-acyltransferase YncA